MTDTQARMEAKARGLVEQRYKSSDIGDVAVEVIVSQLIKVGTEAHREGMEEAAKVRTPMPIAPLGDDSSRLDTWMAAQESQAATIREKINERH